jgi:hypothetical protein
VATLTLAIALGIGTAWAKVTISSNSQMVPNTISGHNPPNRSHADIIGGSVNGHNLAPRTADPLAKRGPLAETVGLIEALPDESVTMVEHDL